MYLFVSPKDSLDVYPTNTWKNFTVELPLCITDASTRYRVALTHVFFSGSRVRKTPFCHVLSSVCDSSIVGGKQLPLLGTFYQKGAVYLPSYHTLTVDNIKRLTFAILNSDLKPPEPEDSTDIYFTLHFEEIK